MKFYFTFFAITLYILALGSCGKKDNDARLNENALHLSIGASPQSIDPHVVTGVPGIKVLAGLGESLVSLNLETQALEPGAATHWELSEDGLVYTFFLRQDALWSNGEPVSASDFVFAWQRGMTPSVGWQYATDFYFIDGAEAYHTGANQDPNSIGVKAVDDYTLKFKLVRPYPLFLKQLTSEIQIPLHKTSLEQHGKFDDVVSNWTNAGNFVSNGPFYLKTWEINKIIVLEKNPHYWDAQSVKLDKIYLYPIETEAAEERSFRSGQIQFAFGDRIPVDKIAVYREKNPENLKIINTFATYFYLLNVTKAPFDDVRVRQALAHAIDRKAIVTNITKAGEEIAVTLNPPAAGHHAHVKPLEYDVNLAKQLLAEAGFPNGENFPTVSLIYNTADVHRKVALAIQQMWKSNLGINVTLENQEWKVFLNTRQNLDFAIARAGSISSLGDPQDFLESFKSGHGMNNTGWGNSEYDKLMTEASATLNLDTRYQLLAQAENILLEEMPLIPLYYYANSYLIHEDVKGHTFNPLSRINYKDIYIDRTEK